MASAKDEALYTAPAFQFYVDDFIGGTHHLENEEVGAYVRLICYAWQKGDLPNDVAALARITHTKPARMRTLWKSISDKFAPHERGSDRLIQRRLEEVRNEAAVYREGRRRSASAGGRAKADQEQLPLLATLIDNVLEARAALPPACQKHAVSMPERCCDCAENLPRPASPISDLRSPDPDPSDQAWVQSIREQMRGIARRLLHTLDVDERHLVARYHCLVFGNCTKNEANNKAKASQVAGAFASMARNETYGKLSVMAYVRYANKVHENRERKPWFDPWLIRGVVQFQEAS